MLDTKVFGGLLKKYGYDFYSGVPCSFLKPLINYAINNCNYVMAANEGDAVAICAGAQAAGKKTVALMQNSGLGNAVSPLTSLNAVFKIPVLGFVSLRGEPGLSDEPQHELMGVITDTMLETMKIDYEFLSANMEKAEKQLDKADKIITSGRSFFFIVKKGTFESVDLLAEKQAPKHKELPIRHDYLKAVTNSAEPSSVFIATTGFTGRELHEIEDNERNFYMVGSLGCASSFGLGLSLSLPGQKIIVLDGDGAVLMRMGSLAGNAAYKPDNLVHILLDNNAHESTGGQFTVSDTVDYIALAKACGYKNTESVSSVEDMRKAVKTAQAQGGLFFIYARIKQGAPENLGRPKVKPPYVAKRFTEFLTSRK